MMNCLSVEGSSPLKTGLDKQKKCSIQKFKIYFEEKFWEYSKGPEWGSKLCFLLNEGNKS